MRLGEAQTKLLDALREANAPQAMIDRCLDGEYDDYRNKLTATPCIDLVNDARRFGLRSIEQRAKRGEFDGTKADSDAWARENQNDPEMGPMLRTLGIGPEAAA